MNRFILPILCSLSLLSVFGAEITQINGYAPKYVGKQVDVYKIVDFISMKQERIASATVGEDSTFNCSFYLKETQKLILVSNNNKGYLFAKPGASYEIFFPDRNAYDPYRPLGNAIELSFFNLDTLDINYKILEFNRWTDEFLARYYTKNNAESVYFSQRLDTFKIILEKYYKSDTTDIYFNYHRKFGVAKLDDMRFVGSRNKYEKYDFYIRNTLVSYQNEAYMSYVTKYYSKLLPQISLETNNKIYLALLKSSPTLIMRALDDEYTLKHNNRLREIVMIQALSEAFYEKDYPQTNILTVLDSVSKFALFENNKIIAQNIVLRLNELAQGAKAPEFALTQNGKFIDLKSFQKKHLYLFFVKSANLESQKQMDLLVPIFNKYRNEVNFLMVVLEEEQQTADQNTAFQQKFPWESVVLSSKHEMVKTYQVENTPHYVLIDPFGYVVGAPALGPLPNGQYDTIDKLFYQIKKAIADGTGTDR